MYIYILCIYSSSTENKSTPLCELYTEHPPSSSPPQKPPYVHSNIYL